LKKVFVGGLLLLSLPLIQDQLALGSEPSLPDTIDLSTKLSSGILDRSLGLGLGYLVRAQKPEGNFVYAYDLEKRKGVEDDDDVRQAGALWGLAFLHREMGTAVTHKALEKGFEFYFKRSRTTSGGRRYVVYPNASKGKAGTVALLSLALIDFLKTEPPGKTWNRYRDELEQYINFLLSLRKSNGQFRAFYDPRTGKALDETSSPYYDGEALLALVRAEKELGFSRLKVLILGSADAMYREYVIQPLRLDPHSHITKGFYQWGSMAYLELFTSGWQGVERFGRRTIRMAAWMVYSEHVLRRRRNTAYAFEGLISAWEVARLSGNEKALKRLSEVVDLGLYRLTEWQVGGPLGPVPGADPKVLDPFAQGGVMDGPQEPVLRIDTTQHQMHAALLARRYLYPDQGHRIRPV